MHIFNIYFVIIRSNHCCELVMLQLSYVNWPSNLNDIFYWLKRVLKIWLIYSMGARRHKYFLENHLCDLQHNEPCCSTAKLQNTL